MKKNIYITDLHFEHVTWKSELAFQKEELQSFQRRLEEVIPKYTDKKILAKGEQFQNQFIVHNEVIDTYLHDINSHEQELVTFAKNHPVALDHVHFKDHKIFREKIEMQRDLYSKLKKKFLRYLTKTM
jgi:hypothetical protein